MGDQPADESVTAGGERGLDGEGLGIDGPVVPDGLGTPDDAGRTGEPAGAASAGDEEPGGGEPGRGDGEVVLEGELDPADRPDLPPPSHLIGAKPSVLIPIAPGTNRNEELAVAFRAAGADVSQVPLQLLRSGDVKLVDHQILALPGGFSYGDALGAGRLLGLDLSGWFAEQMTEARNREMPIIGICNGFQALVRAGLLPGPLEPSNSGVRSFARPSRPTEVTATLSENANGRFECRWVHMAPGASHSPWMANLVEPVRCPVAHGEGRFVSSDLAAIEGADLVAFRYCEPDGAPAAGAYPANPNRSEGDIAGIVDPTGLILGLMPHPEDHVFTRQDPQWRRNLGGDCLGLFRAGVAAVARS